MKATGSHGIHVVRSIEHFLKQKGEHASTVTVL